MNIWLKSLLAGSIVTIAFYFLSQEWNKNKALKRYTLACTVSAKPDTVSKQQFSLSTIIGLLGKKLKEAGYDHEIKKTGGTNFTVSLFGMTDTVSPFQMLISNGRVQFREVYTTEDILPMLKAAAEEINKAGTTGQKNADTLKSDTLSKNIDYLVNKLEEEQIKKREAAIDPLIEFSQPYNSPTGETVYPAGAGVLKLKDTAAVRSLFEQPSIKNNSRPGILLCFGQPEKTSKEQAEWKVSLYFLKAADEPGSVILGNEDVEDSRVSFSEDGKAQINFQFNDAGTLKWAYLTRKNVNKSIAILLDNVVISAPNVLSAIENGNSEITGNYTMTECKILSSSLKSSKLPAELSIIGSSIKPEKGLRISTSKLLVLALCFAICSGLAFFIFKTLKAT